MDSISPSQLQALADLLCPEREDDELASQAPRGGKHEKKYESRAKPNFKVKAKVHALASPQQRGFRVWGLLFGVWV